MKAQDIQRKKRLALLALSSFEILEKYFEQNFLNYEYSFVREPETGLVMARGRAGNSGRAFNIGEMLVSRCTVKYQDYLGQAWILGGNLKHAELAAFGDALSQNETKAPLLEPLLKELSTLRTAKLADETRKTLATKVDFITMVRGEDKND